MAKRNDRPTLATVAERAGVSIKTASRVLNGEKHVAASTAEKVETAAEELGFRLNSTARRLRAGAAHPISASSSPMRGTPSRRVLSPPWKPSLRPSICARW